LNSPAFTGVLRDRSEMRHASSRARITARAATAGWHGGRDARNGWWRHRNGGYGWVGPLYWPFVYDDIYDYAMWGFDGDDSFWGYGYSDIFAGIFSPYVYDDLTGYLPQSVTGGASGPALTPPASATPDQLTQMCGADSGDIGGIPVEQFRTTIQATEEQRAALDALANSLIKAAQDLKATCPRDIALTAPSRLKAMQQRIAAMIDAVRTVQPPLERFYGLLNDEQKARLNALADDARRSEAAERPKGSLAQSCGAAPQGVLAWPRADIDQTVQPTEAQRTSLSALQNATTHAADLLKASCPTDDPLTPPARLTAVGKRLDAVQQAVGSVSAALNDFYATLSDEQKARFEAIGPQRTAQLETLEAAPANARRRGVPNVVQIIRRLMSPF
jgi:hypothetical protein